MENKKSSQKPSKSRDRKSVLQICGPVLQFSHLLIDPMKDVKIQAGQLPFDDTRHFDRDAFEPIEILGSGNFGTVYKGILKQVPGVNSDITIAIKTISYEGEDERRDFMNEIKIMGYVEPHHNLVSMIGFCKQVTDDAKMWLLLEYCQHGELLKYLVKNKKNLLQDVFETNIPHSTEPQVNSRYLIRWAYDISKGMEYLNEKKIMHGDLAARNIMLTEKPHKNGISIVAMVADFGLSKDFHGMKEEYIKSKRLMIPWRWMAIEFLNDGYFTLTSDVWSFGVVVWELLAFGKKPYGFLDPDNVIENIKLGHYLPCPDDAREIEGWPARQLYHEVTRRCFVPEPENRADFFEIGGIIENYLTSEESIIYSDIKNDYYTKARRMSSPLRNFVDKKSEG